MFLFGRFLGAAGTVKHIAILVLVYVLSYLMVSNFRYLSFKHPETSKAKTFQVLVGGRVLHFIVVATEPPVILFALGILYVSSGPLGSVYRLLLRGKKAVKEENYAI